MSLRVRNENDSGVQDIKISRLISISKFGSQCVIIRNYGNVRNENESEPQDFKISGLRSTSKFGG